MCAVDHGVEVGERAEDRVDVGVVGDVVAHVGHRRGEDRREPDRVDAEVGDVGQPLGDAGEVADAVAVRVLERPRIDLVDHRSAPPIAMPLSPLSSLRALGTGGRQPRLKALVSLLRLQSGVPLVQGVPGPMMTSHFRSPNSARRKPAPPMPLRRHHPLGRGQPQRLRGDPPLRRRERRPVRRADSLHAASRHLAIYRPTW